MKSIASIALEPGMTTAEDVISYKNDLLIPALTPLDETLIKKLSRHSVMCISIMEPEDFASTHYEKVNLNKNFKNFQKIYESNFLKYKALMISFVTNGMQFHPSQLLHIYRDISATAPNSHTLLDYLYTMLPSEDDLTHAHCYNSALIAGVFAKWLKLSEEDTKLLILSGFLYDIGKLKLPNDLIWKPGKLTEAEFARVKDHTAIGVELLKNLDLNKHIVNATMMHHERCDGSGYPSKLRGDKIDKFAKYIAIIDSYEAMTSPRMYRESLHPFQVIENFEKAGFLIYEETILRPILSRIANSQVGYKARLKDGRTADILVINEAKLSRPLLKDESGLIDLAAERDLKIEAVL